MSASFSPRALCLSLLAGLSVASPLAKRMPDLVNCNADQTNRLTQVFTQLTGYILAPYLFLHDGNLDFPFDPNKNAYSHYFRPEDRDRLTTAFNAMFNPVILGSYTNIRCADETDEECSGSGMESFAFAQPWPESFAYPDHVTPGQRQIVICPLFWTDPRTTRDIPDVNDQAAIDAFCQFKESKKYSDWETGAHTILHEISHLDEYGKAAAFDDLTIPPVGGIGEYQAHGTLDWRGNSSPGNARTLKTSSASDIIDRWQNAESLAAFTLELMVWKLCGVDNVLL